MHDTFLAGTIPKECHADMRQLANLESHCGSDSDRNCPGDDGNGATETDILVNQMHGAAHALRTARFLAQYFGNQTFG